MLAMVLQRPCEPLIVMERPNPAAIGWRGQSPPGGLQDLPYRPARG